ncbi:MAG TPA: exodeoxyribonuclease VII large subunit, partial [Usitatibacter sp.]
APPVLTVAELNRRVRAVLENQFEIVWVAGELSNVKKAPSGHWYFCLKDPGAQIDCAMFRTRAQFLDFRPENGLQVEVRARVTLYEARGSYQLVVEEIRKAGLGALYEAFGKLKAKLQAEGLFEADRKRALPSFPRAIGIVTSPAAAALRDVLTTLARRASMVPVILYPAQVQGEAAAGQIARAIEIANSRAEVDVLIVCRGGGSIEDLWAFNEEIVARAIAASSLPVVSGVGHETDFSIADFVADLRAPTPTAAAAAASPDREGLSGQVAALGRRLARDMRRIVDVGTQRLDSAARRLLTPAERLARDRERIEQCVRRLRMTSAAALNLRRLALGALAPRLRRALPDVEGERRGAARMRERLGAVLTRNLRERERRLGALRTALAHLDPTQVLGRGYSIVRDPDGHVRTASAGLAGGDALDITFARGGAAVSVKERR